MEEIFKKTIKLYLGDHILDRVQKYGEKAFTLESEEKEVTMMCSDLLPFTSISQSVTTKYLTNLLNEYLAILISSIKKHNGIINHIIGNSVFSYWENGDHPKSAFKCCLESHKKSKQFSKIWEQKGSPELITTYSINTGIVYVGNFGSAEMLNFTPFGDQVNFSERLQSANKNFGTQILISESSKLALESDFQFKHVQEIMIKGKSNPVNIFTIS